MYNSNHKDGKENWKVDVKLPSYSSIFGKLAVPWSVNKFKTTPPRGENNYNLTLAQKKNAVPVN